MKLFDQAFYLRKYPDVAAAKVDPWRHYLKHGASEGRKPHPLFDPEYYLRRNAASLRELTQGHGKTAGDLLTQFLESGDCRRLSPHPLFDSEAYLRAHPEVAARGENPLMHSLRTRSAPAGTEGSLFGCAS